ncbi:hypothetical protein [Streptomyces scabiei]|uniref:hypothetical protein n=1 Tax=Streptomyces scabiei TaxID=1930 RepID=UPI00131E06D4|nr:hypothetical protein [Streptomyces scabiei]
MAKNDTASGFMDAAARALVPGAIGTSIFGVVGYFLASGPLTENAVARCSMERPSQPSLLRQKFPSLFTQKLGDFDVLMPVVHERPDCAALLNIPGLGAIHDVKAAAGIVGIGIALGVFIIAAGYKLFKSRGY